MAEIHSFDDLVRYFVRLDQREPAGPDPLRVAAKIEGILEEDDQPME